MLRAGSARVRITPPLGSLLAGNAGLRREAARIQDHLHASALVLADGDATVALVSCDVIGVDQRSTDRIRSLVSDTVDIPPGHVLVTATHTHTGPQTVSIFREQDEAYVDSFEKQVASAIRLAHDDLSPATLAVAQGEEPSLAHNRRLLTDDDEVVLPTQDVESSRISGPEGPTDPTVSALLVESDDAVSSVLVNYTTHTDLVTGYDVSADFPGYLADALRGVYGDDLVVPYLPGAAGNVSAFDPSKSYESRSHYIDPDGLQRARRAGRLLAGSTLRTVANARSGATDDVAVAGARRTVSLETRRPSEQRIADAKDVVADDAAQLRKQVLARNLVSFASYQRENPTVDVEVQAIQVGTATIVALPGEPFVEFGLRIRDALPGPVFVAGYSNDLVGYVPTQRAFENGGYETTAGWVSRFVSSAGTDLTDTAVDLARPLATGT